MGMRGKNIAEKTLLRLIWVIFVPLMLAACATASAPDGRSVEVPTTVPPLDRYEGLNEKRDPVTRVKLGRDVLMPQPVREDEMPDDRVGPFELRGETLASALQLILDDYDVSLAFESEEGLKRKVTVSNLHGKLRDVVKKVCSLADLYCHFEAGTLTIKDTETFVVDLPPIGGSAPAAAAATTSSTSTTSSSTTTAAPAASSGSSSSSEAYTQIAAGLEAVIGTAPVVDTSTRVMIYTATQRTNKHAMQYFERLRKNTALIIFETHIWEVTLNSGNRTGINWNALFNRIGNTKFNLGVTFPGAAPTGVATPISISAGAGADLDTETVLEFISERGSVKTISQPQITVLSGSSASLSVSQKQNYVSGSTTTPSAVAGVPNTTTATTGTVDTGLTMNVTSAWDQSTVYGNLSISLNDLLKIDEFNPDVNTTLQLPQTTTRSLQTAIRVRPGDAILIGGLVSEKDDLAESGPGFMKPLFPTSRGVNKTMTELVFLLRPRVVAFDMGTDSDTPPITDAPSDGIGAPDLTDHIKGLFGQSGTVAVPLESGSAAALPAGISPEAFAPQDPVMNRASPVTLNEDIPASLQDQDVPQPLVVPIDKNRNEPMPVTDHGGLNR